MIVRFWQVVLGTVLIGIILYFSFNPQEAPLRADLTFESFLSALGSVAIIVLLVERATEMAVIIWRQPHMDSLLAENQALAADAATTAAARAEAEAKVQQFKAGTNRMALATGFTLAILVCAAGVGLLNGLIDAAKADHRFLRGVDIVLTASLIAGGSDSFHKFVRMVESFFTESRRRLEAPTPAPPGSAPKP